MTINPELKPLQELCFQLSYHSFVTRISLVYQEKSRWPLLYYRTCNEWKVFCVTPPSEISLSNTAPPFRSSIKWHSLEHHSTSSAPVHCATGAPNVPSYLKPWPVPRLLLLRSHIYIYRKATIEHLFVRNYAKRFERKTMGQANENVIGIPERSDCLKKQ